MKLVEFEYRGYLIKFREVKGTDDEFSFLIFEDGKQAFASGGYKKIEHLYHASMSQVDRFEDPSPIS